MEKVNEAKKVEMRYSKINALNGPMARRLRGNEGKWTQKMWYKAYKVDTAITTTVKMVVALNASSS